MIIQMVLMVTMALSLAGLAAAGEAKVLASFDNPDSLRSWKSVNELAIDRGVPLFNDGQFAACAAVYEVTCEALRAKPEVSYASRKDLERALQDMRAEKSVREKAWILRRGLDRTLARD